MYGRLNKNMGFSMIVLAFFFLFEPSYALIDPFPDIIGYSILCLSLINLADINDKIKTSFKAFRWGILLSALRIASSILLNKLFDKGEQSIGSLLFVFIFAFFEIAVILPGYRALFSGLLDLGMFESGEAVYYRKRVNGKNATEKMTVITSFFIVAKNIICSLPEFTSLQTNSSYEFIFIVRILSIMLLLPLSLFWIVKISAYFIRVKKDAVFVERLTEKYIAKTQDEPELYICRPICVGLTFVMASFILSIDIFSENVNLLPDMFFYSAMLLTSLFLKKHSKKWSITSIISVLGVLSSLVLSLSEKSFFAEHTVAAIKRDVEAYNEYCVLFALYVIETVIAVALTVAMLLLLKDIFYTHTSKTLSNSDVFSSESEKKFKIHAIISLLLGITSSAGAVYYIFSLPRFDWSWIYYYSGIISEAISLVFIISICVLINYIKQEIKFNYGMRS